MLKGLKLRYGISLQFELGSTFNPCPLTIQAIHGSISNYIEEPKNEEITYSRKNFMNDS